MIAAKWPVISTACLLMIAANGTPALAWGDLGHKVICEIAYRRVSPATRAAIDELMRETPGTLRSRMRAHGLITLASERLSIS